MIFTGAFWLEDVDGDGAVAEGVLDWPGVLVVEGVTEVAGVGWDGVGATELHPARTKLNARAQVMPVTPASRSGR
jgi:hypothetical protein